MANLYSVINIDELVKSISDGFIKKTGAESKPEFPEDQELWTGSGVRNVNRFAN